MDLANILNVRTLNDYIAATETIVKKCTNLKIQLNMSAVLNLKKVRSLEIEYFNKCGDNGAGFIVFERMLKQPPSKTWGLIGKELVSTLQYWLDAVRRHMINHSQHWWTFLRAVLSFIKEIKSKDTSLLSTIVELTADGMLDLASNRRLDEIQRQQVLQTFNEYCAESSRELRNRMKDRLAEYFVKLSAILSSCGHVPAQLGVLEALLRWLVGRHDARVRRAAAAAWFPPHLFRRDTVQLFLDRPWREFYQDARDFLNSHNAYNPDCVTSVVCKKLSAGGVNIISGPQSRATWLDVNAGTKTITIILDSRVLEASAASNCRSYETLTLAEDNVRCVQLYRTSSETLVEVQTLEPLQLQPAAAARALVARVASARLRALDAALRAAFADKYQVLLNLDAIESSPSTDPTDTLIPGSKKFSSSEEEQCSVIPPRRRKHSGYIVRSRNPLPWNSPSTASTTSLAQLHDKLAALPHIMYNKEAVKVSIQPELSMVREVSECEDRSSISQSQSARPIHVGVCQRQSDGEVNTRTKKRNFACVTNNRKTASLMLAATLGSTDESVINDTYEKIYRNDQEIDLLDLLVKEALQNEYDKDSGIITDKKTQDTEVIENTPIEKQISREKISTLQNKTKTKCTVVSNSTTDESNTEFTNEAPCYVSDRKYRVTPKDCNKTIVEESKLLDAEAVDAFFSRHISENATGRLVISPTLAKKINETSSEASENILDEDPDLNKNSLMMEAEIIDCLNDIVDEVARNFNKCTEMLRKEQQEIDILEIALDVNHQSANELPNVPKQTENIASNTTPKAVTLKLQPSKKRAPKRTKQNTKQTKAKRNKVMDDSTIEDDNVFIENADTNSPVKKFNTPLIRKKRKLYSPKDDDSDPMEVIKNVEEESRKSNTNKTPIATCYKELEIARQTRSRIPRKIRASTVPITSPKTKKLNDIFDKLKENVDNEEKIMQVVTKANGKDITIYNFSSGSEDDDFIKKKKEVKKRVNSNNIESTTTKRRRCVNRKYTDSNYNSSTDENSKKPKKRKVVKKTKPRTRKVNMDRSTDLIDERIREAAPEILQISFVKDSPLKNKVQEPEPVIEQVPVMEEIPNGISDAPQEIIVIVENKNPKKKKTDILQMKKGKSVNQKVGKVTDILAVKKEKELNRKETVKDVSCNMHDDRDSPLPGLVVETEKSRKDDITASVEATMLQKFNKIYKETDVDESDGTQNLLLRADKYIGPRGSNNDVNLDKFDRLDAEENISINETEDNAFEIVDQNQNKPVQEKNYVQTIDTIVLSDLPSEKSIATDGKSPITGHNDLDESPPNMASLKEHIEDRDLEIQDMSQSMADFFLQLRERLQAKTTPRASMEKSQTSPVLPTRLSSKECAITSKSGASTSKASMCSKTLQKYGSPSKSVVSSRTLEVVLERMSSDEINKWLPMPCSSRNYMVEEVEEESKRYNTRLTAKKSAMAKKNSPINNVKNKIQSSISPIRLTFDINDNVDNDKLSGSLRKDNLDTSYIICKTPTPMESREASKDLDKRESIKFDSQKSQDMEIVEQFYRKHVQNSSLEYKSSAEEQVRLDKNIKDKSATEKVKVQSAAVSPEGSKIVASVNEWFKRNTLTNSLSKGDTEVFKEIIEKVLETLETTLEQIQQENGNNLASMLVDNQKYLISFREEARAVDEETVAEITATVSSMVSAMVSAMVGSVSEIWAKRNIRLKELMKKFEQEQKKRAFEVTRTAHGRNNLMVQLLKEDLQATLDFIMKQNK